MNNRVNNPLVTIVTATYKKFERLFETMQSVINQDYPNIEYIIADDGSPNFPQKAFDDFLINNHRAGINITLIRPSENRGTVKNLNNAYKNSCGSYILNLSCGDVFFAVDVVSKIVDRFLTTNCRVLVTSRLFYSDNYKPICFLPHYSERNIISKFDSNIKQYSAFISGDYYDMASGSAMYFSRETIKEFDYFDERYILWEDGPFLAKYLYKYPLEFAYDIVSIWYEYGGMSTDRKFKNPLLVKDDQFFNCNERLIHIDEIPSIYKEKCFFVIRLKQCNNKFQKLLVYLRHPLLGVQNIIVILQRKYRTIEDKRFFPTII